MNYQEYQPCSLLQPFVEAYWTLQTIKGHNSMRIVPDGCSDLICSFGNAVVTPENTTLIGTDQVILAGIMTRFTDIILRPGTSLFGIRFRPSAFTFFYAIQMSDFADNYLEFERPLLDLIFPSSAFTVGAVDNYLLQKMTPSRHYLMPVVNDLISQKGHLRIDSLAEKNFCSKRQLERNFKTHVGVSAKELSNIYRYIAAFDQLQNKDSFYSLSSVAFDNGYYDQSHLTNQFKKYSGKTPSEI